MEKFRKITRELTDFIEASPTCYHVTENARKKLAAAGMKELQESQPWKPEKGRAYFTVRGDSSLIAFRIPAGEADSFQMIAAHSDSPSFRIKENPEICRDGAYVELNVEKYGGALCAPWFDRPLSIAGRAVVEENGALTTKLVNFDRDLVLIPSLAIHMNRGANDSASYKIQSDMLPLFGDGNAVGQFQKLLARELGTTEENILGKDLFLYPRAKASFWGAEEEYFSSPRLDDLQCAYSALTAFLQAENPHAVTLCCIFNNEEVGSLTKQGADSTFLSDVLERVTEGLGISREKYLQMMAGSFLISADNAHAVHPNHMDKADPTNHPHMNEGVVLKWSANQKYTTDAVSGALFTAICRKAGVPIQNFHNHSDVAGGSTLGNISNAHVSLNTVDIGAPQLAMHSPYETGGVRDTWYLEQAMEAFYRAVIRKTEDGPYILA